MGDGILSPIIIYWIVLGRVREVSCFCTFGKEVNVAGAQFVCQSGFVGYFGKLVLNVK